MCTCVGILVDQSKFCSSTQGKNSPAEFVRGVERHEFTKQLAKRVCLCTL